MAGAVVGAVGTKVAPILLGYPDEEITEQYSSHIDFSTNKIGGIPDWICGVPSDLNCSLCNSGLKLVIQIYAPIEGSSYHRTLYILACIQPACWNKAESWKCYRGQKLETKATVITATTTQVTNPQVKLSDWLDDADDWGSDDEQCDIPNNSNIGSIHGAAHSHNDPNGNFESDFDEMSLDSKSHCILRDRSSQQLEILSPSSGASSPISTNDSNANEPTSPEHSGAAGGIDFSCPVATAEIETEKDHELEDLVAPESPTPLSELLSERQTNIPELFFSTPNHSLQSTTMTSGVSLTPFFLAVEEETFNDQGTHVLSDHERQLIQEYSLKEGLPESVGGSLTKDVYEKTIPKHGDLWFHKFLSVMQHNPGHVIRYTREVVHTPIFLSKPDVNKIPKHCQICRGPLVCELQILPSLIPSLKLNGGPGGLTPLEFGSVQVYTCVKSCWDQTSELYKSEPLYLQAETL